MRTSTSLVACSCSRWRVVLPLVVFVLGPASGVTAGQIHVERYGLAQVAEAGGHALKVEVIEAKPGEGHDRVLKVKVLAAWPADKVAVGREREVTVYGGVVWDDPRRSPVDRRLRGGLAPGRIEVGSEAVIVQAEAGLWARREALPADAATLRKLKIFFDPRGRVRHAKLPRGQLLTDLGDADLAPLAFAALERRGGVPAAALLPAAPDRVVHALLEGMKVPARARFFRQALPHARAHPEAVARLIRLGTSFFDLPVGVALAPIALLADPSTEDGHQLLRDAQLAAQQALESGGGARIADAYAPVYLAWSQRRERYESPGEGFKAVIAHIRPAARRAFLRALLARVSPAGGGDRALLSLLAPELVRRPDPAALEAILSLEPFAADVLSTQEYLLEQQVKMLLAIVAKRRADAAKVARRIEPYLRYGLTLESDTRRAYDKLVGSAASKLPSKAKARTQRSEHLLAPGARGVDLAGFRIDFDADTEGAYRYRIKSSHHSDARGKLLANAPWLAEGLEAGRVFTLQKGARSRAGGARLKVTLWPEDSQQLSHTEAELLPLAEAAAKEAACGGERFALFEPERGRLQLQGQQADGSRCAVAVGAYTGAVELFAP